MIRIKFVPVLLLLIIGPAQVTANNIQVTSPTLTGNNLSTGTCFVQFDISWENSWRLNGEVNWDAAWVFVKFKTPQGVWQHAQLDNSGHVLPAGSQLEPGLLSPGTPHDPSTNPVVGVFIRRSNDGSGMFSANGVQLHWNYFAQGVGFNAIVEVRVFAVEMVYVNQGAFAVGSGGSETNAFTLTTINTASATTAPSGTGSLVGQAGGFPTGQIAPASANWPNGFNAFYCMKYEVTQQQYVDFLNTLTRVQQNTRTLTDISGTAITNRYVMFDYPLANYRNGIRCDAILPPAPAPISIYCDLNGNGIGGEATDGKELPCNMLSWEDLTAYLDWSALRPMTELEFEKACRGTIAPVANEFPWGTTGIATSQYSLGNAGAANEGVATNFSTSAGNAVYSATNPGSGYYQHPMRVGIFAANSGNNGRVSVGASYYGIMELGGNVYERPVTIGNADGRAFTGTHGNGSLVAIGNSDAMTWPPFGMAGAGYRGGAMYSAASELRISERVSAIQLNNGRSPSDGGRGVRTAP